MARSVAPLKRRIPAAAVLLAVGAVLSGVHSGVLNDEATPADVGASYRVRYAVEDLTTGQRSDEVVEVDGPLRSRRLSAGLGSATTASGVFDRSAGSWRQVAVVPPGEVGQDLRLPAALAWAAARSLATRDGTGTVAGRDCTWWLSREPLDLATVAPATEADRARSCVGDDGLLLADTWRAGDRDLRRRTATEIRAVKDLDVFDGTRPQPLAPALALTAVEPLTAPVDDLVVLSAPPGLALRAAARSRDLDPGTTDVGRRFVRAVYADARDLVVVDQVHGDDEAPGEAVPLGRLGTGHVRATGGGLVVEIGLGTDRLLRVRSSLPYDDLVSWLRSLRRR